MCPCCSHQTGRTFIRHFGSFSLFAFLHFCIFAGPTEFGGISNETINIIAENGFRDLNINIDEFNSSHRIGTVYCDPDSTSSCVIETDTNGMDIWRCDIDGDETCNTGIKNFEVEIVTNNEQCIGAYGLGYSFLTPTECAQTAYESDECTDPNHMIMWSEQYYDGWGCFCCLDGAEVEYHWEWDLYQFSIPTTSPTSEPTDVFGEIESEIPTMNPTDGTPPLPPSITVPEPDPLSPSVEPSESPTVQPTEAPTVPTHPTTEMPTPLMASTDIPTNNLTSTTTWESTESVIENWCDQSQAVSIWISFSYQIGTGGISKSQITSIITNITVIFIESEISSSNQIAKHNEFESDSFNCHMNYDEVVHDDYFTAGICYECTDHNVLSGSPNGSDLQYNTDYNTDYNTTAMAVVFEDIFREITERLFLVKQSTSIEVVVHDINETIDDSTISIQSQNVEDETSIMLLVFMTLCAVLILIVICYCHRRWGRKEDVAEEADGLEGVEGGGNIRDAPRVHVDDKSDGSNHSNNSNNSKNSTPSNRSHELQDSADSDFDVLGMEIPGLRDTARGDGDHGIDGAEHIGAVIVESIYERDGDIPDIVETNSGRPEGADRRVTGWDLGDV